MTVGRIFFIVLVSVLGGMGVCRAQSDRYYVDAMQPERPRAKMDMGVSAGAVYMGMTGSDGMSLDPRLGVRGALVMSLCWHERYAVQLELGYVFNKIKAERSSAAYDVRSNIMEIPILFSYRGLGPVRLNAGPVLSLAGTGRYDAGGERLEFGRLRPTLGYAAGVGVALSRHVTLDARYTGCFGRTDNWFEGTEFSTGSRWVSLSVGYVF